MRMNHRKNKQQKSLLMYIVYQKITLFAEGQVHFGDLLAFIIFGNI